MKNILALAFIIILAVIGYNYYLKNSNEINKNIDTAKNNLIQTTDTGYDTAVSSVLKGVSVGATPYYVQNKNYGVSATQNICNDTVNPSSIGNIVSNIQKYTKAVTCVPAQDFPSRSFTIIAPSRVSKGQYFCADQSGFVGLISSVTSYPFMEGVRCK